MGFVIPRDRVVTPLLFAMRMPKQFPLRGGTVFIPADFDRVILTEP